MVPDDGGAGKRGERAADCHGLEDDEKKTHDEVISAMIGAFGERADVSIMPPSGRIQMAA